MERGGADHPCLSFASRWVRDLFSLESSRGNLGLWFSEAMGRKLGGGSHVRFWHDKWVGTTRLKDLFPRLFQLFVCKDGMVVDTGEWRGESWSWKWSWRRSLFVWEEETLRELIMSL